MTFAKQIDEIIGKRHEQANILAGVIEKWRNLKKELEILEQERNNHISIISDTNSNAYLRLQKINLSAWIKKINNKIDELDNLKTRLSRGTLNIGVVGRMRQGKSQLLQSLTGLTNAEIPTSSDGVCTRILSKVFHEPSTVRNEIQFHSADSLLEIIHLYYDILGLATNSKPKSIDDFHSIKNEDFPRLPPEIIKKNPSAKYLYGILRGNYYSNYEEYKKLLTGQLQVIPQAEIINYVTRNQQNSNVRPNSKYLSVRELRIFCEFPDGDEVGKIGVVDLPGLGDDDVSDAELLIKTIKQDIDFILFVRRPDTKGDNWQEADRKMYGLAEKALEGFPIKECSFIVLNKDKDNPIKSEKDCNRFRDEVKEQGLVVSNVVIANCTNSADVKKEVLTPALENLTKNIGRVYEQYLRFHNQDLITFQKEISHILSEAFKATEGFQSTENEEFNDWFEDKIWVEMRKKFNQENKNLLNNQNKPHEEFEKEVNNVVEKCLNGKAKIVPDTNEIEDLYASCGSSYKMAFYMCINEVKTNLIREFKTLDKALKKSEIKLQLSVAKILYEQGWLEKHSSFQEYSLKEEECVDFFVKVKELVPQHRKELKQAFEEIQQCTDTYGDTIISWIQPHLDTLKPDQHLDPISRKQFFTDESNLISQQVNELQQTVVNLSEEEVNKLDSTMQQLTDDIKAELLSKMMEAISQYMPFPLSQKLVQNILYLSLQKAYVLVKGFINSSASESIATNTLPSPNKPQMEKIEESIMSEIDSLRKKVVEDCQHTLKDKLNFPNKEAHTKFDKFFANAIAFNKAETAWRDFYQYEKNQELWPGAKSKENAQQLEKEWQDLVNNAIDASSADGLVLP
ncbi:dynamin family protein [Nostoc sp. UHCC 0870]|uniref:dynamin family protein n=1 Tax=Nostoc sp. UHCC 0870 TaxID=2914041 RepID=UPI001EE0C593|nr:dynamin family protein [Nostoc sp. UHCC 0870]UKO95944.1 dynamin family protein [Nostoc sp. UHCC 0870]